VGDAYNSFIDTDGGYGNHGFLMNTCPNDNCQDDYYPDQGDTDDVVDGVGNVSDNCYNPPTKKSLNSQYYHIMSPLKFIYTLPSQMARSVNFFAHYRHHYILWSKSFLDILRHIIIS